MRAPPAGRRSCVRVMSRMQVRADSEEACPVQPSSEIAIAGEGVDLDFGWLNDRSRHL